MAGKSAASSSCAMCSQDGSTARGGAGTPPQTAASIAQHRLSGPRANMDGERWGQRPTQPDGVTSLQSPFFAPADADGNDAAAALVAAFECLKDTDKARDSATLADLLHSLGVKLPADLAHVDDAAALNTLRSCSSRRLRISSPSLFFMRSRCGASAPMPCTR